MLFDIIILIGSTLIFAFASIFRALNLVIPDTFTDAVEYFVAKLSLISGIVNVDDILTAIGFFLTFTTAWYTIKLVLWTFQFIPFIGGGRSPKI